MIYYIIFILHIVLESLPISSSGHRVLFGYFLNYFNTKLPVLTEEQDHLLHIPTAIILSIFLLANYSIAFPVISLHALFLIFFANLVTGFFYFLFKIIDISKFPLFLGLLISSVSLLLTYYIDPGHSELTIGYAILIGASQGLALLPGISRMAATYVAAYCLGVAPCLAFMFSLAIQLPLIIAALLKAAYKLRKTHQSNLFASFFGGENGRAVIFCFIMAIAMVISYKLLCLVLYMAINKDIYLFGIYLFFIALFSLSKFDN